MARGLVSHNQINSDFEDDDENGITVEELKDANSSEL